MTNEVLKPLQNNIRYTDDKILNVNNNNLNVKRLSNQINNAEGDNMLKCQNGANLNITNNYTYKPLGINQDNHKIQS